VPGYFSEIRKPRNGLLAQYKAPVTQYFFSQLMIKIAPFAGAGYDIRQFMVTEPEKVVVCIDKLHLLTEQVIEHFAGSKEVVRFQPDADRRVPHHGVTIVKKMLAIHQVFDTIVPEAVCNLPGTLYVAEFLKNKESVLHKIGFRVSRLGSNKSIPLNKLPQLRKFAGFPIFCRLPLMEQAGQFSKSFVTDIPADLGSAAARHFRDTIPKFPEEAVYIYSFKEGKMIYAHGWEEILGYKDSEISMLTIVSITSPEYAPFSNELNDKALRFILSKTEDLEKYSFTIELKKLHKNGTPVPLISKVGVFSSENGQVTAIIGHSQINHSINLGKVMRYAAYGPGKSEFEEDLNKQLFRHYAISKKEKEAVALVARGYSFKEVADHFKVSPSAIEKRIIPMYKRFGVKSLTHLVSFAYDNHILP